MHPRRKSPHTEPDWRASAIRHRAAQVRLCDGTRPEGVAQGGNQDDYPLKNVSHKSGLIAQAVLNCDATAQLPDWIGIL